MKLLKKLSITDLKAIIDYIFEAEKRSDYAKGNWKELSYEIQTELYNRLEKLQNKLKEKK